MLDFSGITLPFTASDVLEGAMAVVTLLGPYILLGVALAFVPKIISVIKAGITSSRK